MPAWLNLPNAITAVRLALVAPVVAAILDARYAAALALFLAAGFTDLFDGLAARRLGSATGAGAYFDPIADKCLLVAVFLAMSAAGLIPVWFVALVLGRDLLILAGAAVIMLATTHRKFPPSRWGKLSTFFQISAAVVWMVRNAWPGPAQDSVAQLAIWLSTVFTAISGIDYLVRGVRLLLRPR